MPAVGQLEAAEPALGRAGEGPRLVAEQLAGDHARGQGGAVDRHQQVVPARAELVDGPGDQLLAGAGLAEDQDGAVGPGDLLDRQPDRLHRLALAGQTAGRARPWPRPQVVGFPPQPLQVGQRASSRAIRSSR